uniref:Uncharacterized protein n=1 Tax=Arundo donax TaxID=35708 RepID=A0A0A9DUG7_ARUDO
MRPTYIRPQLLDNGKSIRASASCNACTLTSGLMVKRFFSLKGFSRELFVKK